MKLILSVIFMVTVPASVHACTDPCSVKKGKNGCKKYLGGNTCSWDTSSKTCSTIGGYSCPSNGCCSNNYQSCDASWCGTTKEKCESCSGNPSVIWLESGAQSNCIQRWGGCGGNPSGCCGGTCRPNSSGWMQCLSPHDDPPISDAASETDSPTIAPVAATLYEGNEGSASNPTCLEPGILLKSEEVDQKLPTGAFQIESSNGNQVTFSVTQLWKQGDTISWIAPVYTQGEKEMYCDGSDKREEVAYNVKTSYVADCKDGKASVDLFVHDGSFKTSAAENEHGCNGWGNDNGIATYTFELSCNGSDLCGSSTDYTCVLPDNASKFSVITEGDASIAAHNVYSQIAIGGAFSDPQPDSNVVVGAQREGKSYVKGINGKINVNWKGGKQDGADLVDAGIDFGHFEWLARNAKGSNKNGKKVFVMTSGGTFDTYDFVPGGQGEDNGNTLVIFNTADKVTLTKTHDGRQFGPSVIAPFSRVELLGQAGYIDGFVVAKSFATTGNNPSNLQIHGDVYTGTIECKPQVQADPTPFPTSRPTPVPTAGPTPVPTPMPSPLPTENPTPGPTARPTPVPTAGPTPVPTPMPSPLPTENPTPGPTARPTPVPTAGPTPVPTSPPTAMPTSEPSSSPTLPKELETEVENLEVDSNPPTSAPTAAPVASSNGDPHFKTWKNEHFEYHGQCDMILVKDKSFANEIGLEVQIRTKLIRFWSYIKSAAIRIGDDIFEVEGSDREDPEQNYWINLEYQGPLKTIGGFPISAKCPANYKCLYEIDLSSKFPGQKIEISTYREFVRVDFKNGSEESYGNAVGLLGDFKTGKTLARDGVTALDDFYEFGSEWQVLPFEDMLFHDVAEPQFPQKCILPEDPRGNRRRRLEESSISESDAEKACSSISDPLDRKDCVYDILATQDLGMVGAY